jgi:hypothetical protein
LEKDRKQVALKTERRPAMAYGSLLGITALWSTVSTVSVTAAAASVLHLASLAQTKKQQT